VLYNTDGFCNVEKEGVPPGKSHCHCVGLLGSSCVFGTCVNPIGDLNNDGVIDLVVGARRDYDGGTRRGAVWILFMNTNGTVKSEQKISDLQGNFSYTLDNEDFFGTGVDNIGDMDGDGINDLIVGAYGDDDGGQNKGAFYVLYLNANGTVKSDRKVSMTQGNFQGTLDVGDYFGRTIDVINDLDGNGINDLMVSCILDDDGGTNRGAFYFIYLNSDGTVAFHEKISYLSPGFNLLLDDDDRFGTDVTSLGDLDGDGQLDYLTGAYYDDDGGTNRGAIYILLTSDSCSVSLPECNLMADFETKKACAGDTTYFTDLSTDIFDTIINWDWDFGDGDSISGIQNPDHVYSTGGTYIANLIVTNNGLTPCTDTISIQVIVSSTFEVVYIDENICEGDSIALQPEILCGQAPYTATWSPSIGLSNPNITNPVASPTMTENYTVTITDDLGQITVENVIVTVDNGCCKSQADFYIPTVICEEDIISITEKSISSGNVSYAWNFGSTAVPQSWSGQNPPNILFPQAGNYLVGLIIKDDCGIDTLEKKITVNTLPEAYAGGNRYLCEPDIVYIGDTALGNLLYYWIPGILVDDSLSAQTWLSPTMETTLSLKVIDPYTGCVNYDSIIIVIDDCECVVQVPNIFTPNGDGFNDEFKIMMNSEKCEVQEIHIFNRWGKSLFSTLNSNEVWDGNSKSGSPVVEGTYFYLIKVDGETYTGHVVLNR